MEHRLNLVHVEVDRVHAERGLALNGWVPSRGDWIAAYRASYRRLEEALRDGKSVVFDATSYRKTQRRRLRRMADAHRVPTTVVYLDISAQEAQRRRSENQHCSVRAGVSDDEEILRYDATLPVDDWIDNVLLSYVGAPSRRDR
jgi:predicted kinase